MKRSVQLALFLLLALALAACGGNEEEVAATATVTGSATYVRPLTLPENSVARLQIQNASLADAPPEQAVISEQIIEGVGNIPFPFATLYDPAGIEENATYLLYVRIEDVDGNLIFLNTNGTPVLTHGSPSENVEVQLELIDPTAFGVEQPPAQPLLALTGRAVTSEPVELPPGSTAHVMIQNGSLADAPPEEAILAEQFIQYPGQFPIPFAIEYEATAVMENSLYLLYARIEDADGNLLYLNTNGTPVITQGNPTIDIEVLVEQIQPVAAEGEAVVPDGEDTAGAESLPAPDETVPENPNSPTAAAAGINFQLVMMGPPGYERQLLPGTEITANFTSAQVSGSAGCNEYSAPVIPLNDYFVLGPMVTTQMICAEPAEIMEQERIYLSSLQGTAGYQYQWATDGSNAIVGLQLLYPLASGGNGALTYVSVP